MMNSVTAAVVILFSVYAGSASASTGIQGDEEHGRYLATLGDCAACHSPSGAASYSGGLQIDTPVGAIFSTNITPDKQTGIGTYSYEDFVRAVREGVGKNGEPLYPAMPYPSFVRITDQDMRDLYAYFMNDVTPVSQENKKNTLSWPFSIRWPLHLWRWMFTDTPAVRASGASETEEARGAYLVQGLAHCGACHTPRGIALQEKAQDETESAWLGGGNVDTWYAPPLRGDKRTGIGEWSKDDLIAFLSTGTNRHSTAFGPMADVVTQSTSQFSDSDLAAVAAYLKGLPAVPSGRSAQHKPAPDVLASGAGVYSDSCSGCHQDKGEGIEGIYPALSGNPAIQSDDPSSVISLVLKGGKPPSVGGGADDIVMPDFSSQLSDQQIADVLNYIRNSWGNSAANINEKQVTEIRQKVEK